VFQDDDEAYNIWINDIGVDPRRVARMSTKTNFWQDGGNWPLRPDQRNPLG